jgi:two-component system chemotaxis sensor kinase CheA
MNQIDINSPEYQSVFLEEMKEILESLENDVISYESTNSKEISDKVKRSLHTLKGNFKIYRKTDYVETLHSLEEAWTENSIDAISEILDCINKIKIEFKIDGIQDIFEENNGDESYRAVIDFHGKSFPEFDIDDLKENISKIGDLLKFDYLEEGIPDLNKFEPEKLYLKIYIELENTNYSDLEALLASKVQQNFFKIVGKRSEKDIKKRENKVERTKVNHKLEEKPLRKLEKKKKDIQEIVVSDIKKEIKTVRVNTGKLDKLVNIAGELIVSHSSLKVFSDFIKEEKMEEFQKIVSDLDTITKELQENVLSIRMIPVGSTFLQFKRMVRDMAKQLGKKVNFEIYGGETEIDKTIIERTIVPLRHMIRNSMDHGIEDDAEERLANGKGREGNIRLTAYHKEGEVIIEVFDDGKGLDKDKIYEKALSKNIISVEDNLSDEEICELIFAHGFTTKSKVTEISGRGVGMDVVKNEIESIGGKIEIETKKGFFTSFKMRLPLTLAIIDGMLIRVGEYIYVVPILTIMESLQPRANNIKQIKGKKDILDIRGEYFPLIRLHEVFEIENAIVNPTEATMLLVDTYKGKAAIMVDEVLDTQQIVIKKLGIKNKGMEKFNGGTILGNGEVALILDIRNIYDDIFC